MENKLKLLKLIHTLIWLFFVFIFGYILYAGIINKIDIYLWIAIGSVLLECLILLVFKWSCPITVVAEKYTKNKEVGFDIYLPKWLAKHNKTIFGTIFILELLLIGFRIFTN